MNQPGLRLLFAIWVTTPVICSPNAVVHAQSDHDQLRQKCENILLSELVFFEGIASRIVDELPALVALNRLQFVRIEVSEKKLIKALGDSSVSVVTEAAKLLLNMAPEESHAAAIEQALAKLKPEDPKDWVSIDWVKLKMGDQAAREMLYHWARLERDKLVLPNEFVCLSQCTEPSRESGQCSVCNQQLKNRPMYNGKDDFYGQLGAIQALLDTADQKASQLARAIIASDAPSWVRERAAFLWGRVEPDEAYPHLRIFYDEGSRLAFSDLAYVAPQKSLDVFESILNDKNSSVGDRLVAYSGVFNAGQRRGEDEIRKWISSDPKTPEERRRTDYGLRLFPRFATEDDLVLLERMLDNEEFGPFVAEIILRTLRRLESQK